MMSQAEIARLVEIVRATAILTLVALFGMFTPTPVRADSPFSSWAAVVVAGDWHSHSGGPSEAFDNARRDVARGLVGLGFIPAHITQLSARARRPGGERIARAYPDAIYGALKELARNTTGGCLVYITSHGDSDGVLVGDDIVSPRKLARMLDETCGDRLTVAIVSACYSGVFVPALASPTRMVLTASRPDRSSFGCGETDKYPYFDACFLAELPRARDFPGLGHAVQNCVAQRERQTHASPPSQPQLSVGTTIAPMLRRYAFRHGKPSICGSNANSNSNSTSLSAPSHC
jgi:Peptidase C13 family